MRLTKQRKTMLAELMKLKSHPTADEFYIVMRRKLPRISLGSVYRNLDALAAEGLIQKLEGGGNQKRFDGDISRHHHIRCPVCGAVSDYRKGGLEEAEKILENLLQSEKFENYRLEFSAKCQNCAPKSV